MALTVLVVGGGRVGAALAGLLGAAGHAVTLIESSRERTRAIQERNPGLRIVAADGRDPSVLEAAGIRAADVVAAVTGEDAYNLVVCALARHGFAVPRTIARIVDPVHAWLFDTATGVDIAVDQADLLAELIVEEMSAGEGPG